MIDIHFTVDGLWAWLDQHPRAVRHERIVKQVRLGQESAFLKWCFLKGQAIGLEVRFKEAGWDALNLTPRTLGYTKRQLLILGHIVPYTSPSRHSGDMRKAVLGGGFDIHRVNGRGDLVTTMLAISGARGLNRIRGRWGYVYQEEFLGFERGGQADANWIMGMSNELARDYLFEEIQAMPPRRLHSLELEETVRGFAA